jgi:UDP-N-acetylmuramoyl-L-alanyl-D-glutamate--2,6-diaminopimelate ligase
VTGTNGKTTVTHLLAAILEAAAWPTGIIGTLSGSHTTPEATELQGRLARFRDEGKRAVAMEVSSHALAMHRVDATRFAVAVFTNLGRDHLDFHGTEERYFGAKARLFEPDLSSLGVVNSDDPHGRLLLDAGPIPMVAFSLADATQVSVAPDHATFTWRGHDIRLPLGGWFNVANALAAATTAAALGVDEAVVAAGLSGAPTVPGRFEPVDAGQAFAVIVDYWPRRGARTSRARRPRAAPRRTASPPARSPWPQAATDARATRGRACSPRDLEGVDVR